MSIKNELISAAKAEWERFGKDEGKKDKYVTMAGKTTTDKIKGRKKEEVEPYASRVGDYWLAIPSALYDKLVKTYAKKLGKLDGTIDIAWSAAFVSYCMQKAGAGTSFPYSSGHATWMILAIKNRKANKLKAALVGYKPGEIPLAVGDLIAKPREKGITYDNAPAKGWFISHSDIVVEVDTKKKVAHVIGGNVAQSVSKVTVSITSDGKLDDDGGWMVHIQNNIGAGTAVPGAAPKTPPPVG